MSCGESPLHRLLSMHLSLNLGKPIVMGYRRFIGEYELIWENSGIIMEDYGINKPSPIDID